MKNLLNRALAAEKRLFILLAAAMMAAGVTAEESLDPIFDSIFAAAEAENQTEVYDNDAYTQELIKMYGGDKNEQFQKVQKQAKEYEQRSAVANAQRTVNRWLTFLLSLMMALFPSCVIVVRAIKGEFKDASPAAIRRTVVLLLLYGIVLFALNYAWLWTMITGETKIMGLVIGLFLLGFVIFAIHTLRKSKK